VSEKPYNGTISQGNTREIGVEAAGTAVSPAKRLFGDGPPPKPLRGRRIVWLSPCRPPRLLHQSGDDGASIGGRKIGFLTVDTQFFYKKSFYY